ncbi:hypothetical protein [Paracoccus rhizosphaerae]|uniref:Uncharacterized protein n=1 Tax=Paracoccus rhizosphaerae TaxID=1133347 RepID=A0ABV6CNU3_9RHOB|nr:hypothetical protein [Paracoccus rhizosphaerae]
MTDRFILTTTRIAKAAFVAGLVATQAMGQGNDGGIPSAQDILRHLPPVPGRAEEPAPAPVPAPAPPEKPAPPVEAAPQPSTPVEQAAPRRSPPAAAPTAPRVFVPPADGSSRTLAEARVVIHYPERGGYERSQELVRLLRAMGTGEVETRPVRYPVDRQSIRYFHAADREVSGVIGDLAGMLGAGGRETVSDFTYYRPSPRNGTVEIWLP